MATNVTLTVNDASTNYELSTGARGPAGASGAITSAAADPSAAEYPTSGQWGVHKNTSSGDVFLAYNDGGIIKKVQLT